VRRSGTVESTLLSGSPRVASEFFEILSAFAISIEDVFFLEFRVAHSISPGLNFAGTYCGRASQFAKPVCQASLPSQFAKPVCQPDFQNDQTVAS
jgi:hypothetical protein